MDAPGEAETGGGGAGEGATPGEIRSRCSIRWTRVVRSRTCSRSCLISSSDTDQVASGANRSNYRRNSREFHLFFLYQFLQPGLTTKAQSLAAVVQKHA